MSIIVFTETQNGKYRKSAFEVVSYAKSIANQNNEEVVVLSFDAENPSELGKYGANKVIHVKSDAEKASPEVLAQWIADNYDAKLYIFPHSLDGSTIAPFVAINKDAALITNVIESPTSLSPFTVKRKSFSGKGIMTAETNDEIKVVTVAVNAFGLVESQSEAAVEEASITIGNGKVKVGNIEHTSGKLDLKEAEIVVSAGRGMKGPENWGMIEELADNLGAATACSKPVSDMGWRPHTEHVGQTGKAIAPNLYIAIGISGAIQHLAGVNASKNIVVINTDPEAPFFKSADYGIVGDAFEVVPKLNQAIKEFKG